MATEPPPNPSATTPAGPRQKKAVKPEVLVVAGAIVAIILLFTFLVLPVRHVRVWIQSAEVEGLAVKYSHSNPSFSMALRMQVNIKNPNFGHYEFEMTNLMVSFRGLQVGEAVIEEGRAGEFSTKKVKLMVAVDSGALAAKNSKTKMRKDTHARVLSFNSKATLTGKVHLFEVFKRRESAEMNCVMDVNIELNVIQNLKCG